MGHLPGWSAVDANALRINQPGFDVLACHDDGRQLRISVKSVSTGGSRHDYGIGRSFSFQAYPANVYAFVDLTGAEPCGDGRHAGAGAGRRPATSAFTMTR